MFNTPMANLANINGEFMSAQSSALPSDKFSESLLRPRLRG